MAAKREGGQIIFEQASDNEPWAKVPTAILRDERVNGNAVRLYAALYICGWRANYQGTRGYDGQEALAEEFAFGSQSAVARALAQLVQADYVRTERLGQGEPDNIIMLTVPGLSQELPAE